jgi:hypothetical protein
MNHEVLNNHFQEEAFLVSCLGRFDKLGERKEVNNVYQGQNWLGIVEAKIEVIGM